jgi:ATP adenylyltransferase
MKSLYAPWRHSYVTKKEKVDISKMPNQCVFCDQFAKHEDDKNFIIKRFKHCAVIMNKYPYNSGHVMVLPLQHTSDLNELTKEVRCEIMEVINLCVACLKKVTGADGFNSGINLGSTGGGGIPQHIHFHVLPRWRGDTSFLTVIGETPLICADFVEVYKELKPLFDETKI